MRWLFHLRSYFAVLCVWQICSMVGLVDNRYIPSVLQVARASVQLINQNGYVWMLFGTLTDYAGGLLFAALVSLAASILLACVPTLRRPAMIVADLMRSLPSVATIPFLVLPLGLGFRMHMVAVAYAALWPLLISTVDGIYNTESRYQEVGATLRLAKYTGLLKIALPASLPYFATGLRTASGIALLMSVSVEMLTGIGGIGALLIDSQFTGDVPPMYAAVGMVGLIGYVLNECLLLIEVRLMPWRNQ